MIQKKQIITPSLLKNAYTYETYKAMVGNLLANNKTTGTNHSEAYINYTKMNVRRMERTEKTFVWNKDLKQALNTLNTPLTWLVITEAWCGDVAPNLPVINFMAQQSQHITLRIILRDENLAVMDTYLTNGGRSIPKLVCLNPNNLKTIGTWGPRPAPAQQMTMDYKHAPEPKEPYMEFVKKVQLWYAKDKSQTIQLEFIELLKMWTAVGS